MFDRWFDSFTEVATAVAAAGRAHLSGFRDQAATEEVARPVYVLGPDSTIMADHLEELARRGVIRPYRPAAPR
jgi:hypothetical protein